MSEEAKKTHLGKVFENLAVRRRAAKKSLESLYQEGKGCVSFRLKWRKPAGSGGWGLTGYLKLEDSLQHQTESLEELVLLGYDMVGIFSLEKKPLPRKKEQKNRKKRNRKKKKKTPNEAVIRDPPRSHE